jgi:peptide/nickel transport system substrate-binding protein
MRRTSVRIRSRWGVIIVLGIVFFITLFWSLWHNFFLAHSQFIPTSGGMFTESTIGTQRNLNPLSPDTTLFDRDLGKLMFAGLLRYDPSSGEITDGLAHFRISEDSKTYFLTLKSSARFQNGNPVTTDDVLFTFEKVIQHPDFSNHILRDAFEYVSLNVVDEQTVSFVLPEQNVFFLSLLTIPILPAKYFKNALIEEVTDPDFSFNKNPIGAGPYQLENIVPGDDGSFRVFLERNPYFYGKKPYIKHLVFYVYPRFEHLNVSHPWTTFFSKIPFVRLIDFEKKIFEEYQLDSLYSKREYLLPRFTGLFFNLDKEGDIQSISLRKALNAGLSKEKVLESAPGWNQVDSFFFFEGVENWHISDFPAARTAMRDGGFSYDATKEVRTNKSGEPVSLRLITSTAPPVYALVAQNIARTWEKELAIKIEFEALSPEDFQTALRERNYDIVLFGQNFSENFDSLSTWHSSQSGELNLSNLTHEDVDFLIDEVRFSGTQTDLFALNEKLTEILPATPLATPKYNLLSSQDLQGFSENFGKIRSHSDRFLGIENWYFNEKRDWDWEAGRSKFIGFFRWLFGQETQLPSHEENLSPDTPES